MNKFTPSKAAGHRSVDEITGSRRLRRMRKADWSRRLVQENRLSRRRSDLADLRRSTATIAASRSPRCPASSA